MYSRSGRISIRVSFALRTLDLNTRCRTFTEYHRHEVTLAARSDSFFVGYLQNLNIPHGTTLQTSPITTIEMRIQSCFWKYKSALMGFTRSVKNGMRFPKNITPKKTVTASLRVVRISAGVMLGTLRSMRCEYCS